MIKVSKDLEQILQLAFDKLAYHRAFHKQQIGYIHQSTIEGINLKNRFELLKACSLNMETWKAWNTFIRLTFYS